MMNNSTIVIGGGLAGISAALALAKHGQRVTLLEARSRLGGRAGSFVTRSTAGEEVETVDYCQHVGMGCCTNLKQLIRWLEQDDAWQTHKQLHFYGPQGQYRRLRGLPGVPAPFHLGTWLWQWPGLSFADRWSVARGMLAIYSLRLDDRAAATAALPWLLEHRQTTNAIDNFWQTIIVSALGERLERVSLAAVGKVLQDGFLYHRHAFHLLVPTRPLDELFGKGAYDSLTAAGVDLLMRAPVERICQLASAGSSASDLDRLPQTPAGNGDAGQARFRVHYGGKTLTANQIILAVAWHQLPKIDFPQASPDMRQSLTDAARLQSSPITGVHTWWDRAWLPRPHAAIVGRLCQWVFPKPHATADGQTATNGCYYQIVISASRTLPRGNPSAVGETIQADLAHVFPEIRAAKLLRCKTVSDPQAVFSISPQSIEYRPPTEGLSSGMLLAGDWTATGWPATMEGAILSGFRAAETVLQRQGQTRRIVRGPLHANQ